MGRSSTKYLLARLCDSKIVECRSITTELPAESLASSISLQQAHHSWKSIDTHKTQSSRNLMLGPGNFMKCSSYLSTNHEFLKTPTYPSFSFAEASVQKFNSPDVSQVPMACKQTHPNYSQTERISKLQNQILIPGPQKCDDTISKPCLKRRLIQGIVWKMWIVIFCHNKSVLEIVKSTTSRCFFGFWC